MRVIRIDRKVEVADLGQLFLGKSDQFLIRSIRYLEAAFDVGDRNTDSRIIENSLPSTFAQTKFFGPGADSLLEAVSRLTQLRLRFFTRGNFPYQSLDGCNSLVRRGREAANALKQSQVFGVEFALSGVRDRPNRANCAVVWVKRNQQSFFGGSKCVDLITVRLRVTSTAKNWIARQAGLDSSLNYFSSRQLGPERH